MSATSHVRRLAVLSLAVALAACAMPDDHPEPSPTTDAAFARLAALQGDWTDADGGMAAKGQVVSNWRLTGGGSAVVETLFPGGPEEMVTVYYRDGGQLVLTHYCAVGNQPHLRVVKDAGNALDFDFVSGANIDPAHDMHMHSVHMEFVSADELRETWQGWDDGHPVPEHVGKFHLVRKKV